MKESSEQFAHRLLSGQAKGVLPSLLRGVLAAAEPLYSGVMSARNLLYDTGRLSRHRLDAAVLSVGNITAGGTGKTPMVRWLAKRLHAAGMHPAVLLRGYKRSRVDLSDEQVLLQQYLGPMVVHADPDRVAGGRQVLRDHPDVDIIILDDGFQHRRLARDFDLVLIDASAPFGHNHVHPRGLLREPLRGLRRADAFILTRSDQVPLDQRERIENILRMHNPTAPVYRARHAHTGLRSPTSPAYAPPDLPLSQLAGRRFFTCAGIGQPGSLHDQLATLPGEYRGHYWFPDHHDYTEQDLAEMKRWATAVSADVILVTEKDWTKLQRLPGAVESSPPIWRLELEIQFDPKAAYGLIQLIQTRIDKSRSSCT